MHRAWTVGCALALALGCAPARRWDPRHPTAGGPPPPSPRSPSADERVTTARPRFSWRLPEGESAGVLMLCRDPGCRHVLVRREAAREWTPDQDLPSGTLWWRLFGKAGDAVGSEASETRALAVDTAVSWTGTHVEVVLPASDAEWGKQLTSRLDAAVELYARLLGVSAPPARIPVTFYATAAAFDQMHRGARQISHELGVTMYPRRDSSGALVVGSAQLGCHVRFGVHDNIGDELDATGMVEEVALHELAHAVQFLSLPLYTDLPAWWTEGLSELLSSRALEEIFGTPFDRQVLHSNRLRIVRHMADAHRLVPLADLLDFASTKPHDATPEETAALYAESFYLLHYLATVEPARFWTLLTKVANMQALKSSTSLLRELTGELGPFQDRWLAALSQEQVAGWSPLFRDSSELRSTPGELSIASIPGHFAIALYDGPTVALPPAPMARARIETTLDVRPHDEPVGCLFAADEQARYVLCVDNGGRGLLSKLGSPHATHLARSTFPAGLLTPGAHKLTLELGAKWTVRIDDRRVFELAAPAAALTRWGVGGWDGRSHFRGAHLVAPADATTTTP